ncbi:MAG: prepilin-type N-terminal cleavage/methylation domain-containing protein [Candidatus Moranbacteria bacterium]|nr:prepilin-type N-terminal cleavage/methylation domain-containing protein [Candidatus Moranbacteria bacterium]
MKLKKEKGFTLIEMMIVVAIIGLLAGMVLFAVNRGLKKTRATTLITQTSDLRDAMILAGTENCPKLEDSSGTAVGIGDLPIGSYGCGTNVQTTWNGISGCSDCKIEIINPDTSNPCIMALGFEEADGKTVGYACNENLCGCYEAGAISDCAQMTNTNKVPKGCAATE